MNEESIFRRPDAVWSDLDGQVAVLDMASGQYYEVRGVGGAIWRYIDEPRSLSQIVEHVMAGFDVERAACETDIRRFIDNLRAAGLLADGGD